MPYQHKWDFDIDDNGNKRNIPVHVHQLALCGDNDDNHNLNNDSLYLAVVCTDNSVYVVRLGTNPLTTFSSVPELTMQQGPNNGASIVEYRNRMTVSVFETNYVLLRTENSYIIFLM